MLNSPKFHNASLRIKRKVRDVNVTRALVNCRWFPNDSSVAIQNCLVHYCNHVIPISTTMLLVVIQCEQCSVLQVIQGKENSQFVGWLDNNKHSILFMSNLIASNSKSSYSDLVSRVVLVCFDFDFDELSFIHSFFHFNLTGGVTIKTTFIYQSSQKLCPGCCY